MAKKPGERAVTEAPKGKTEDETAPVLMKRDEGKPDPSGTDKTAPIEPSELVTATTTELPLHQQFDDPTIIPPYPLPQAIPQDEAPRDSRARTETVAMAQNLGRPPEMPTTAAPPPLALGDVEAPTHMPGPRDIPSGEPADRAPAPGRVPPGDSRSLRKTDEFALIYRLGTYVISRYGAMGTRGQWRVVEYPTSPSAAHSYAKECSRFVSEGFSDYRG
ncbi:hypothetical protein BH11MYX1_BH11MYX1_43350 [soil metagenome]